MAKRIGGGRKGKSGVVFDHLLFKAAVMQAGMTRQDIANKLGIKRQTLYTWMSGECEPSGGFSEILHAFFRPAIFWVPVLKKTDAEIRQPEEVA